MLDLKMVTSDAVEESVERARRRERERHALWMRNDDYYESELKKKAAPIAESGRLESQA